MYSATDKAGNSNTTNPTIIQESKKQEQKSETTVENIKIEIFTSSPINIPNSPINIPKKVSLEEVTTGSPPEKEKKNYLSRIGKIHIPLIGKKEESSISPPRSDERIIISPRKFNSEGSVSPKERFPNPKKNNSLDTRSRAKSDVIPRKISPRFASSSDEKTKNQGSILRFSPSDPEIRKRRVSQTINPSFQFKFDLEGIELSTKDSAIKCRNESYIFYESNNDPIISIQDELTVDFLEKLVKGMIAKENHFWFLKNIHSLKSPECFFLTWDQRKKLLRNLVHNSGFILIPLFEKRLKCRKSHFQPCSLMHIKNFEENEAGLKKGIVLQEFLAAWKKEWEIFDLGLKKEIEASIPKTVIEYLVKWTDYLEADKFLSSQVESFDRLKINIGKIPHIKHVFYAKMGSNVLDKPLPCIKTDSGKFLLDSMKINGEYFFNTALLPDIFTTNKPSSNEEKAFALISCLKEKNLPFYRRILLAFIFQISKSSLPNMFEALMESWKNIFIYAFCKEETRLSNLIELLLKKDEQELEKFTASLVKSNDARDLLKMFLVNFWTKASNFLTKNKEISDQLCYLIGLEPWIQKNASRFYAFINSKESLMDFKLLETLFSHEEVFSEMTLAHAQVLDITHNTLTPIFQVYTEDCFEMANAAFKSLHPILHSKFDIVLKSGMDTEFSLTHHNEVEMRLIRKFSVLRKGQKGIELATIPVSVKANPYESAKFELTVLNTLKISPLATEEEALEITNALLELSQKNCTDFKIENTINEEGEFTFIFEDHKAIAERLIDLELSQHS